MPTFSNPVILPILFTIFGFLAGALVASIVFGKMNKGDGPSELPEGLEKGRHEVAARLWKDRKSGRLLVEMNDEIHTSSQTLSNVQKLQLTGTQRELGSWLNIPAVVETPIPIKPPTAPQPASQAPAAAYPTMPPAVPAPVNRPAQTNAPTKPKDDAKVPEHLSTMVEQIDEILQGMLENSPLKNRGIKLQNDPRLGAVVWIGITRYDGVDSVDDPEVKQLLRTAVDEWERRTEKDPRWAWKQQG